MQDINGLIKEYDNDNLLLDTLKHFINDLNKIMGGGEIPEDVLDEFVTNNTEGFGMAFNMLKNAFGDIAQGGGSSGSSEKVLYMDDDNYLYEDREKTTRISARRLRGEFESGFYIYTGTTTNYRALTVADAIDSNNNRYTYVVMLTIDGTITKAYSSEYMNQTGEIQ